MLWDGSESEAGGVSVGERVSEIDVGVGDGAGVDGNSVRTGDKGETGD